jgi:hypothetical protein
MASSFSPAASTRVFVLHMIQARNPGLVGKPFFARYNPSATWLSDLEPAFAGRFPWESEPEVISDLWAGDILGTDVADPIGRGAGGLANGVLPAARVPVRAPFARRLRRQEQRG